MDMRTLGPVDAGVIGNRGENRAKHSEVFDDGARGRTPRLAASSIRLDAEDRSLPEKATFPDQSQGLVRDLDAMLGDNVIDSERPSPAFRDPAILGSAMPSYPVDSRWIILAARQVAESWQRLRDCDDEFGHYAGFCTESEGDLEAALDALHHTLLRSEM